MEFVNYEDLKHAFSFYKSSINRRVGVKYGLDTYVLNVPNGQEQNGLVELSYGLASYIYCNMARLFGINSVYTKIVCVENIYTSISEDYSINNNSRIYALKDVLGINNDKETTLYEILRLCKKADASYFNKTPVLENLFLRKKILDFITVNQCGCVSGLAVTVTGKTLIKEYPVMGGGKSLFSGYSKNTLRNYVNNAFSTMNQYERKDAYLNKLKRNGELYNFIMSDVIPTDLLKEFMVVDMKRIENIISNLDCLDEWFINYLIEIISLAINLIESVIDCR